MPDTEAGYAEQTREQRLLRIGRAIEEHRGGLSQLELAERAGVAINTVALLERGKTMPWPVNRRKIESALGWPSGTLTAMFRDGAPAPPLAGQAVARPRIDAEAPPTPPPMTSTPAARLVAAMLTIALDTTALAATVGDLVLQHGDHSAETVAAIREFDRLTQALEASISASIPVADSEELFDQIVSVLSELRRHREHIHSAHLMPGTP
ncbi:hypothetical protein AWC17_03295 [Mycobacterium nebraskense]|uniref:HTH cro/C1-type domain-containing protein n=1 Tax=Mycobacterium nebraskense TaxID=244292 RepID=A0A1X1ZMR8_9MYCO|nr:helix-turn-helix transcriptional regulator [Mycobacterium nebraskense]ORW24578.1 hypothetical protein AWC17_03295 [Mycobacterium nebraskense]